MSNSSSELPSLLQMSSIVRAFWDSVFLSKHVFVMFLYVRLCYDGLVVMLEISVLGFRPKCASNGVIFVVEFGINLIFSIMFATRFASVTVDQLGSISNTAKRLFIVCTNLSTIPVPL